MTKGDQLKQSVSERRRREAALRHSLTEARDRLTQAKAEGADRATLAACRREVRELRRATVAAHLRTVVAERRLKNLRTELHMPVRERALAVADTLVGVMEQGGNNQGPMVAKIIRENSGIVGEAWCGDFIAYCYRHAGSKVVTRPWAAVKNFGFLTGQERVMSPQPGDLACYSFDHIGIVVRDLGNGMLETIEGNTGRSGAVSDSTTGGDGVYRKHRSKSLVSRYVRILR
jgi:hypothetical protein